jgi:acyl carrier protein
MPTIARITDFIVQRFPAAKGRRIGPGDHLLENGLLDSLGVLDLVAHLEQEFGIAVADEDLVPENFGTLERIAAFVAGKRGANGTP